MELPSLNYKDSKGRDRVWSIRVIEDDAKNVSIQTEHGIVGCKLVKTERTVESGKNLGKTSETTVLEQAISEAKSKWAKKQQTINRLIAPMLAVKYQERSHDIQFPCFVQPKYDGVHAIYHAGEFISRGGFTMSLPHICDELKDCPYILDGELFSKSLSFDNFNGLLRKEKLSAIDEKKLLKISYYVFDVIDSKDYKDRLDAITSYFGARKWKCITMVPTYKCETVESVQIQFDRFVGEGYEGIMIRNMYGAYKCGARSKDLQKLKPHQDEEFEIVGFTEGEGTEKGAVIWKCITPTKKIFLVRPKGTIEQRRQLFKRAQKYVGLKLTVIYDRLTTDGIPRFPVGKAIRAE